jgi:hypothetical protein
MLDFLGCCKNRSPYPERRVLFHPFYRVYFASEKHVTRTSKTPYSRRAVNHLRNVDLSNNMVDATTNSICCHSINLPCTVFQITLLCEFLICSKCYGVSHIACAKRQIWITQNCRGDINGSHRNGDKNEPKSFLPLFSIFYATGHGCPSTLDAAVNTGIYLLY